LLDRIDCKSSSAGGFVVGSDNKNNGWRRTRGEKCENGIDKSKDYMTLGQSICPETMICS
jgi:hypothetical protein